MIFLTTSNLSRSLISFMLVMTISACAAIPGTLEVSLQPESQALAQSLTLEELDPVLQSILFGSIEDRRPLVSYTTIACTTADGLGGPPKCENYQEEGTLVQVLPILGGEGSFVTPETIDQALDFVVMGLYAIYRVPEDAPQAGNSPAGEFGLVFTREMNAVPFPLTVFVEDGRIVRLHHHIAKDPEDIISQLPVDSILMNPGEAQLWEVENAPGEPDISEFENGTVMGSVCFPGESIPEMTLYFKEINRGDLAYENISENQSSFSTILPPGSYIAFAYPVNSSTENIGGMYSQAVLCGFGDECTDHAPRVFEVLPGEEISGIDICDWYSPGDVPPDPALPDTQGPKPSGSVNGQICYPSEFIPEMTLFFEEVNSQDIIQFTTTENQDSYSYPLPAGQYIAFAYLNSGAALGGSYSNAVLCGLGINCTDHSPVQITINPGETITGIDICDWYSPDTIPPDPRAALAPYTGMVYRTSEGDFFWIEANGNSNPIHSGSMLAVPYSGPYGVYLEGSDLFALDLFTGESYQLTYTPDLVETSYKFDVGLPEQIVFTARPADEEIGPGYTGGLYIINLDGTSQRTLDDEHNAGVFSTSSDGQATAYGAGETAFLYRWDSGVEVFNPRDYGMNSPKGQVITSPSWSPGIDEIAWFVSGFFDGQDSQGFGIFNLYEQTFQLVHPFQSLGIDITPPSAVWSQDGEWLAISVFDQDPARSGVWLVNVLNPEQEIFMGTGSSNPVFGTWRADRKILTYFKFDQEQGESRTWMFDLVTGEHQLVPLPPEAQVIAWR